jgi:hypothetical protein
MRAFIGFAAFAALTVASQARAESTWLRCEVDYIKNATGQDTPTVSHSSELYEFRENPVALIAYDPSTGERGELPDITADKDFVRQESKRIIKEGADVISMESKLTIDRKTFAYNGWISMMNHQGEANQKGVTAIRSGKCKIVESPLPKGSAF